MSGQLNITQANRYSNYLLNREEFIRETRPLNAKDYGAVGNGIADDTNALQRFLDACRSEGLSGFIPAGTYYITNSLNISGVDIEGVLKGYYNSEGTIIKGDDATDLLVQSQANLGNITYSIKNIRLTNGVTGLKMSYAISCRIENIFIEDCINGIQCGQAGIIGGIWNQFRNCHIIVSGGTAFHIQGNTFNNSNLIDTCDFTSDTLSVHIELSGGLGTIDNVFINTEIRNKSGEPGMVSLERGALIENSKNTKFLNCYFECEGPALNFEGFSVNTSIVDCVFGSLRNDTPYPDAFIYHKNGNCSINVDGGYVYLGYPAYQNNLSLITSDTPSSFTLTMLNEPKIEIAGGVSGYTTFLNTSLPNNKSLLNYTDTYTPVWSSASGSVSLGNASLTGKYTLSGKLCTATILLSWVAGSTINFGSAGDFYFTLPFDKNASPLNEVGSVLLKDGTTGNYYTGVCQSIGTNQVAVLFNNNSAGLKYDNPVTWSSTNVGFFKITYTYEIDNNI